MALTSLPFFPPQVRFPVPTRCVSPRPSGVNRAPYGPRIESCLSTGRLKWPSECLEEDEWEPTVWWVVVVIGDRCSGHVTAVKSLFAPEPISSHPSVMFTLSTASLVLQKRTNVCFTTGENFERLFFSLPSRLCGSRHLKASRVRFTVLLTSGMASESSLTPLIMTARSVPEVWSVVIQKIIKGCISRFLFSHKVPCAFFKKNIYILVTQDGYFTVFMSHLDFICRYRLIFVD